MASLSQYIANPMHTHHFKGGYLLEEQIMALNPSLSSVGRSGETSAEAPQVKVEPEPASIAGICSTMKRGAAAGDHSLHCKRPRRKACISWETVTSVPDHDGYQWRKYGEKKIMNNHHTRCYYKCTYNKEYKCKATKQVQQQDHSDLPIYNVTYFNTHVCPSTASNNNPNIPCTHPKPQLLSSPANSGHILLNFSSKPSKYLFGQEQEQSIIKKEYIERSRSPVASTASTVKESLSSTDESMDSTVKTSGKDQFNASELFSDELIDHFHEFDSMFYGLEDSEFVNSLFETYDAICNNNNNQGRGQLPPLKAEDSSWLLHVEI